LRTIKGARLALARLYHQTAAGNVDPQVAGRLTAILCALIASSREHQLETRITELEERISEVKVNGYARPMAGRRL